MKTIIAGSRSIADYALVKKAVKNSKFNISTVLSGGASGVDELAIWFAKDNCIPLQMHYADWKPNGVLDRSAGHKRNYEMALNADALIAIWDGESPGTQDMINIAYAEGLKVHIEQEKEHVGRCSS